MTGASVPRTRKQRKDEDENKDTDGPRMKDLKSNKEEIQNQLENRFKMAIKTHVNNFVKCQWDKSPNKKT